MNNISLIGRLTKAPEVKVSQNGKTEMLNQAIIDDGGLDRQYISRSARIDRTSMQYIIKNFKNIYNCEVQYTDLIFFGRNPDFYNAGQKGWNCDIFINYSKDIAICTGFRNLKGIEIPKEILEKYSFNAYKIIGEHSIYREMQLLDNQLEFFSALLKIGVV